MVGADGKKGAEAARTAHFPLCPPILPQPASKRNAFFSRRMRRRLLTRSSRLRGRSRTPRACALARLLGLAFADSTRADGRAPSLGNGCNHTVGEETEQSFQYPLFQLVGKHFHGGIESMDERRRHENRPMRDGRDPAKRRGRPAVRSFESRPPRVRAASRLLAPIIAKPVPAFSRNHCDCCEACPRIFTQSLRSLSPRKCFAP